MESLKIGPREVMKINPRMIYARMSGFGQTGPHSKRPGHDINFLAMSGDHQSINQSISQSVNQSINPSIHPSKQLIDQIDQSVNDLSA
jgi:hypothetical protein